MKLSNFIAGIETLRPYYDNEDGYHIGAEHDQFFMYATDRPVSSADCARLKDWGWFQPEVGEDATYSPDEGWSAFT